MALKLITRYKNSNDITEYYKVSSRKVEFGIGFDELKSGRVDKTIGSTGKLGNSQSSN